LKVSEKEMKEAADSSALGERWAPTSSRSTAAVFFAGVLDELFIGNGGRLSPLKIPGDPGRSSTAVAAARM